MQRKSVVEIRKLTKSRGLKVDIPFTEGEAARFRAFVDATGRSQGPWVRTLILAAITREELLANLRPELTPAGAAAAHTPDPDTLGGRR